MWSGVRQWVVKALLGVPAAAFILDTTFYAAMVDGESMQPLLNPSDGRKQRNDIVLLSRWSARNFSYDRGDVVVLTSPRDPKSMMIKRIIGLSGDTIRPQTRYPDERLVLVPGGHCWLEGDHAACSYDSNVYGPVPLGLIAAKAIAVIWPLARCQWIRSQYPTDRVIGVLHSIHDDDDDDEESDDRVPELDF